MIWLKRFFYFLIILLVFALIGGGFFIYKAKYGIATYETDVPTIDIPKDKKAILLFSKTTAFRHGAAIERIKHILDSIRVQKDWFIYETEKGGIFNPDQLNQFDLVIWNSSTGPVLNKEQKEAFQTYITNGGGFLGIHGAGDFSHQWDWYTNELIAADFSHHPIKNHIQPATVYLAEDADSTWKTPPVWTQNDEWYVFHNSPVERGAKVLYWIDGTTIDPNGNLLWMTGMEFGMGTVHPITWYKEVGKGRSFYTSMGHDVQAVSNKNFVNMLVGGIEWAGKIEPEVEIHQ